jgi:GntR family transcriptional regulator
MPRPGYAARGASGRHGDRRTVRQAQPGRGNLSVLHTDALHSVPTRPDCLCCSATRYGDHVSTVPPFDPDAGEPGYLYMAVADHITARITAGELASGSRLPAERDLAADYGVSLATGRRAVKLLRERGLVMTLPVKGTFVR